MQESTFQSFEKVRNELCTLPDLVLREHRIVIPEALREKVIDIAHEGHMGVVKTQALIREKVWFPKISRLVEEKVKSCLACQVTTPRNTREPLQISELPKQPWSELSIDFGLAPTGSNEYLLVLSTTIQDFQSLNWYDRRLPTLSYHFLNMEYPKYCDQIMVLHLTVASLTSLRSI